MGVLVSGAVKVEEGLERLKRNAHVISGQTKAKANARLRPTLIQVRNSLNGPTAKPIIRRIKPIPRQLEHDAEILLNRAKFRTRVDLTRLIDRTILELEKVRHKLDRNSQPRLVAA